MTTEGSVIMGPGSPPAQGRGRPGRHQLNATHHRWSHLSAYQMPVLTALLIAILAALVLPPFLFLLAASVAESETGEWTLANFAAVLASRRFLALSVNSLVL